MGGGGGGWLVFSFARQLVTSIEVLVLNWTWSANEGPNSYYTF